MVGIVTGALCGLEPSLSMSSGSGGKNLVKSSSACSVWLTVVVPLALMSCGTLPNAESSPDFRYLAAFQILSLSARNSSQCFFFCWRMASWYCLQQLPSLLGQLYSVRSSFSPGPVPPIGVYPAKLCEIGGPPSLCVWCWFCLRVRAWTASGTTINLSVCC